MRLSFLAVLACSILCLLPSGPLKADGLGDKVSEPGVFSYQAPKGWTIKSSPASKFKVCLGPPANGFAPNINVVTEAYAGPLEKYVEMNKTALKSSPMFVSLDFVDEKPFTSASAAQGTRLVAVDTVGKLELRQIFYFFPGASSKFVVTASCLKSDGDTWAPIFDASLKTFATP